MTKNGAAPFPRAPWDVVIAWCAAVGVFAFVIVAAVTVLPPALAERDALVADGVRASAIGDAQIVVPEGWVVVGSSDELVVRTPDGALTVRIAQADGAATTVLQDALTDDLGTVPSATIGPFRSETLASGLRVVHADVGADALYAVVGTGDAADLTLTARTGDGFTRDAYRASLGLLLQGVRA